MMLSKTKFRFLLGLFILSGCTVKESRDGSPCLLLEDSGDMCPLTVTLWRGGEQLGCKQSDTPGVMEFYVERGGLLVTAHQTGSSVCNDGVIALRSGMAVDSIYAYHDSLDCNWEWVRDTVVSCKQFATVNITLNIEPDHGFFPDTLHFFSSWNGVDIRTFKAVAGGYDYAVPCSDTHLSVQILRQGDDSLILRLMRTDGSMIDEVEIGKMLRNLGYDWTEDSLEDIDIQIEEAVVGLRIIILDWETGEPVIINI